MHIVLKKEFLVTVVLFIALCTVSGQKSCNDHFALAGRWKLIAINEQPVLKEIYTEGIPYLEIKEKDAVMSGFTGCNLIQGHCEIEGNQIRFQQIISTKKYCERIPEHLFLESLEKIEAFLIEGNTLFLLNNETRILSFNKVE